MRDLKNKIIFYIMLSLCVIFAGLYTYTQITKSIDYNNLQEKFDDELKYKDFQIDSLSNIEDSLIEVNRSEKIRFNNYMSEVKRIDSTRATVKKRKHEKSDIIDAANYIELGNILSGYLE